jgi:hypothetical protein
MLGFSLALIATKGLLLATVLPLLAAFLLMITALTYQLQGWLASLMTNPRRRRTAIVSITALFVLVFQLPNLINLYVFRRANVTGDRSAQYLQEVEKLKRAREAGELDNDGFVRQSQEATESYQHALEADRIAAQEAGRETVRQVKRMVRIANQAVPIGWLPLGVMSATEGRLLPSVLGFLGLIAIGSASLWRSYRGTLRQYQGQSAGMSARPRPAPAAPSTSRKGGTLMLEARLPGLSEPVSAIALQGFRTVLRAPEAKMMLLTPMIMIPVFGSMLVQLRAVVPETVRPLFAFAALLIILFGLLQLMVNQFGFDRDGFRVFVLSSARRRDILLGKNLALVPLATALAVILLPLVQWFYPMRLDHFAAILPQFVSMYLLLCILTNWLSIFAPYHLPAGALKPTSIKASTVLLQLVIILLLFPLVQGVTLLPLGFEALAQLAGWTDRAPLCLALTLAECAVVIVVYHVSLGWLGSELQRREQRILDMVTNRGR